MTTVEELKNKSHLTRTDVEELFESIGAPGEKREEKYAALEELDKSNRQGHNIVLTIESYVNY